MSFNESKIPSNASGRWKGGNTSFKIRHQPDILVKDMSKY